MLTTGQTLSWTVLS